MTEEILILRLQDVTFVNGKVKPIDQGAYHKAKVVMFIDRDFNTYILKNRFGSWGLVDSSRSIN